MDQTTHQVEGAKKKQNENNNAPKINAIQVDKKCMNFKTNKVGI